MGKKTKSKAKSKGEVGSHTLSPQSNGGSPGGGVNDSDTHTEALKASQTGDVKVLKQLLDAGGGESGSSGHSGPLENFEFLEKNIKDLDQLARESFHSIASVEQEIATANLDDIEVDSRDSWESRASRDSVEMFNERREVKWTRFISKSTIDDNDALEPTMPDDDSEEDGEITKVCQLLKVSLRQSWPLFISGAHLKVKGDPEPGKYLIIAKLLGSKSKVLLDEDVTYPAKAEEHSAKFTDPLLLEVPSSSTIILLQIKHISSGKKLLGRDHVQMKTSGYVYIKVKDVLQEDSHRLHDFFAVQKGITATLFCNCKLMSPYMNYVTLLQLGSQNEKHEFGDDSNHFRKIQNEDGEEIFTFARIRYSKKGGIIQRSGASERNVTDMKACLEEFKFPWLVGDKPIDVIIIKLNNKELEVKEIVSIVFKYKNEHGKICFQVVYRKFTLAEEEGKRPLGMCWAKFARLELDRPGKLKNTLKKCRLESNAEFTFINQSDYDIDIEMKNPDVWKTRHVDSISHIVGSWIMYDTKTKFDNITHLDDRDEKIKKTTLRKNGIVARAEVYIHYIKAKKAMCCGASDTAKYIYRGFKLMIQKKYVTAVPALSALVIALKECELQDCL
jgi:hypothetical protein